MQNRRANLDLLRAVAILAVVFFHLSQYVKGLTAFEYKIFALGSYGVDVFFVLSGWLIGGIFFREHKVNSNVKLRNFWGRRWLRTIPPYYVALLFSWIAVYFSRRQYFDINYVFFLQNYYETLPYFLISWSLCVEEHFYIFMPIVLYFSLKYNIVPYICLIILCLTFFLRLSVSLDNYPKFGYLLTATHLRLDGLILGVFMAYNYTISNINWNNYSNFFKILGIFSGMIGAWLYFSNSHLMYSVGILSFSLFFVGILCLCVDSADWKIAKTYVINLIAVSSYSIYLTHALSIHLVEHFYNESDISFFAVSLLIIFVIGYIFYYFIEKLSIIIRDKFLPHNNTSQEIISHS